MSTFSISLTPSQFDKAYINNPVYYINITWLLSRLPFFILKKELVYKNTRSSIDLIVFE